MYREVPCFVVISVYLGGSVFLCIQDALTDMTAGTDSCYIEGLGEQFVHKGILQAAKYIENKLNNMDLLNTAFSRCPVCIHSKLLALSNTFNLK